MIQCSNNHGSPRKAVSLLLPFLSTRCEDPSKIQNAMDVIEQGVRRAVRVLIGPLTSTACTNLVKLSAPSPNVALFGCTCAVWSIVISIPYSHASTIHIRIISHQRQPLHSYAASTFNHLSIERLMLPGCDSLLQCSQQRITFDLEGQSPRITLFPVT